LTFIIWIVAFLAVIAIGTCTIWLPLVLLGIAANGAEGEGESPLIEIGRPAQRGMARVRTLLRLTRDPLLEDRAWKARRRAGR
jgi:hypothetical protein